VVGITPDNLHLSEPIRELECKQHGSAPDRLDAQSLDPAILELLEAAAAPNTRRAYDSDLRHFRAWGGSVPATSELVARYLAHHARTLTVPTLARRLVAIRRAHALEGLPDPTASALVRQAFRGLRRAYGRPQRRVAALTAEQLAAIVSFLGQSTRDLRDRALLLVGFAGAFRRSELSAAVCSAIEWGPRGIIVSIPKSKTDQEWRGRKIGISYAQGRVCPLAALAAWLDISGIASGPVFRPVTKGGRVLAGPLSGDAIAAIVKRRVQMIDFDPSCYSGHSLRAGFATCAAAAGVPVWKIKAQTGHLSDAVLNRYIRISDPFAGNATASMVSSSA
jgi:integrase